MNKLRHHPDGIIFIEKDDQEISFSIDEILTMYPQYNLPEFFIGREYFQGVSHRLYTAKNEIYLDDITWALGDLVIGDFDYLQSLKVTQEDLEVIDTVTNGTDTE